MISVIAAATLLLQPQPKVTAAQVLAKVRKSVHYEAVAKYPRGLHLVGASKATGEAGNYSLLVSPAGEFVESIVSPVSQTVGFDGTRCWFSDASGAAILLDAEDAAEQTLFVDLQVHGWLSPARKYKIALARSSKMAHTLTVASPGGYATAQITVDAKTWLPTGMTIEDPTGPMTVTLSGYRPELGIVLPHKIVAKQNGLSDTFNLTRADEAPTFIRNPYEMPSWGVGDTTFDPAKPAALETKRAFTGHILVHPLLNGKDVGWFLLDTGAGSMVIDPAVADAEKLVRVGELPAVGIGGVVIGHYRKVGEFSLGQATVKNLLFAELDLGMLQGVFGVKVAGVVGYDMFRRAVIEVDLAAKKTFLYDPDRYELAGGKWQPLYFSSRTPVVEASFGARKGLFRLDTGANGSVIFHAPAVKKFELSKGQTLTPGMLGGVGGSSESGQGAIASFELGGKKFTKPGVIFSTAKSGLLADRFLIGTIGHSFMEPFKMVFDYPHQRIAFEPTGNGSN